MYIHIKVTPEAKQEIFEEIKPLHFKASVREPAQQNRANNRVRELLALYFHIDEKAARLISGHHSPSKIFSVPDDAQRT